MAAAGASQYQAHFMPADDIDLEGVIGPEPKRKVSLNRHDL